MSKFLIVKDGKAIKCLECGCVSHHPMDVRFRYCGHCNKFIDPDRPPWHEMSDSSIREMGQFRFAQYMSQEAKDEARKRKNRFEEVHEEHKERMEKMDKEYKAEREKAERFHKRIMITCVCLLAIYLLTFAVLAVIKFIQGG